MSLISARRAPARLWSFLRPQAIFLRPARKSRRRSARRRNSAASNASFSASSIRVQHRRLARLVFFFYVSVDFSSQPNVFRYFQIVFPWRKRDSNPSRLPSLTPSPCVLLSLLPLHAQPSPAHLLHAPLPPQASPQVGMLPPALRHASLLLAPASALSLHSC